MKTLTFLCLLCLTFGMAAFGQSATDKVLIGIYKAEKAKGGLDRLKGLIPKKKAKAAEAETLPPAVAETKPALPPGSKISVVSIAGIDFAKLKALNENIQACQGVQSTSYKFGSPMSTISVIHAGTTEDLLKLMGETSKDIFTEKQIESFEEGKISLKLQ